MHHLILVACLGLVSSACASHRLIVDVPVRRQPDRVVVRPAPVTVDVKEIHADVVSARVIYAKEVHARDGRVGRVVVTKDKHVEHRDGELKRSDVVADTIYAKEIHASYVEADVIYAKEVKIGR